MAFAITLSDGASTSRRKEKKSRGGMVVACLCSTHAALLAPMDGAAFIQWTGSLESRVSPQTHDSRDAVGIEMLQ